MDILGNKNANFAFLFKTTVIVTWVLYIEFSNLCIYLHLCTNLKSKDNKENDIAVKNRRYPMTIHIDDSKPFPQFLQEPDNKRESFASMSKREAAGLKLISDEMEQEKKELEKLRELRAKRFERKKKLLYNNLDLILRHRDEILATPRYANIDAHYAIKGGGLYIGPLSTSRRLSFAGTSLDINLKLGSLLEVWDTDQFKMECKCGGTAVICSFTGSPLSGSSQATAYCPKCNEESRIGNRSFGDYYGLMEIKLDEYIESVAKEMVAKWTLAEAEYAKKVAEGKSSQWSRPGSKFHGDSEYCDLETMINELKLKEFEDKANEGY